MLNDSSARPHVIKSTNDNSRSQQESGAGGRGGRQEATADGRTQGPNGTSKTSVIKRNAASKTISDALRRRAQAVIKDRSVDARSRAVIRYGLATNDPLLAGLVRRVDAGEPILDAEGRLIIETDGREV